MGPKEFPFLLMVFFGLLFFKDIDWLVRIYQRYISLLPHFAVLQKGQDVH